MSLFKLKPAGKDYLWGGTRLIEEYGKSAESAVLAETWELSCHADGPSVIASGTNAGKSLKDYIAKEGLKVLGRNCSVFDDFPILIKFIDARDNLSIQVHPNNAYAKKHEGQFGKTEMWYVMDAEEGAFLYYGFEEEISEAEFKQHIENGTLCDVLHKEYVKKGDVLFIESGTIHAIGKGILIAEIQQNSNVTYRVFDYNRRDAKGNTRELHIDKALDVTLRQKAKHYDFAPFIGRCEYFEVEHKEIDSEFKITVDDSSFLSILILDGKGYITGGDENFEVQKGDSIFAEASSGCIQLAGKLDVILTRIPKPVLKLGIDIGGTDCKIGILDGNNRLLHKTSMQTLSKDGAQRVLERLSQAIRSFVEEKGFALSDFCGIGLGIPGLHDIEKREVIYSNNINWKNVAIGSYLEEELKLKVFIANDADAAALAETISGAGAGAKSAVMITLGTGIGFGLVINSELYHGAAVGSCEFGHSVIVFNGKKCTCGRKGCFEAYASATALIRDAKEASGLDLNPKEIFERAKQGDEILSKVVSDYISYLSAGIVNAVNAYNPEIVILGGGICAQGDNLLTPIRECVKNECFGGDLKKAPDIVIAELGNDAGMIGAASLIKL